MDSERFDRTQLLVPWPNDGIIRVKFTPNADGTIDKESYPFNVNWDYYFREICSLTFRGDARQELIFDMNKCLIEANVLCLFREGVYGIIQNGYNISREHRLNDNYYFSRFEYAKGYLAGLIEIGDAKAHLCFVFCVV